MQYIRSDVRNINYIKTPQRPQWLTVQVNVKGRYHQTIREAEIDYAAWHMHHWAALVQNYLRAA